MRYKLSGCLLILLIATPVCVYGQEPSLVVVEALQPTPTTVKTGEVFVQLYRLRYLDLASEGLELTIDEDNLNLKMLGDFEVVSFCIDKGELNGPCAGFGGGSVQKDFLERIWYLKYRLRIISPEKGTKKIPPLTIFWKEKGVGQTESEAKPKSIQTEKEIFVNYLTTATEDPHIDVRDSSDFGSFSQTAFIYKMLFWFCIAVVPVLWFVLLVIYLRSPVLESKASPAGLLATEDISNEIGSYKAISKRQAFLVLKLKIKKLSDLATGDVKNFDGSKIRPELTEALMDFLRAWLPQLTIGVTPAETDDFVKENISGTSNGPALWELAKKAARYQSDLEKGVDSKYWHMDPFLDVFFLRKTLNQFRWHRRLINYVHYLSIKIFVLPRKIKG